jgi:hypothetical protein
MGQLYVFLFDVEPEDMVKMYVRKYIVGTAFFFFFFFFFFFPICIGCRGRDIFRKHGIVPMYLCVSKYEEWFGENPRKLYQAFLCWAGTRKVKKKEFL